MSVKATTSATGNNSKFKVHGDLREMAVLAAKSRDLVSRKVLRQRAKRARREFDARVVGSLPRRKTSRRV